MCSVTVVWRMKTTSSQNVVSMPKIETLCQNNIIFDDAMYSREQLFIHICVKSAKLPACT